MLKRILAILGSVALLLGLGAVPVAAAPGDVNGGFYVQGNMGVTVTGPTGDITPLSTDAITVTVAIDMGAGVELTSLDTITMKAYWDVNTDTDYTDFGNASPNPNTCAQIAWTNGSGFVLSTGGSTTWEMNETSTVEPTSMTSQTGTFTFVLTPGNVAKETKAKGGEWQFAAEVVDGEYSNFDAADSGANMLQYTQVTAPGSISWNTVAKGMAYGDTAPSMASLASTTVISNYDFNVQMTCADTTWGNGSVYATDGVVDNDDEFGLKADNAATSSVAHVLNDTPVTVETGTITDEDGTDVTTIKVFLSTYSTFPSGTFSGTINVSVSQ